MVGQEIGVTKHKLEIAIIFRQINGAIILQLINNAQMVGRDQRNAIIFRQNNGGIILRKWSVVTKKILKMVLFSAKLIAAIYC